MPKQFDPDDPMELVGVEIPGGDPDEALDGIVLEYLMMGWTPLQIMFLFRSPYYGATHQLYLQRGEARVKEKVQRLAGQWRRGWISARDEQAVRGELDAPGL